MPDIQTQVPRGQILATPRQLYGLDALNFFVAAMQAGFGGFVTVHLAQNNWPPATIGFALSVSTMCSLIGQLPAGAFIDSLHDKALAVRLGVIGVAIAAVLLALSPHKPAIFVALGMQGLASVLIAPGIAAISLGLVPRSAFSERVGRNARFASIGGGMTAGIMGFAGTLFQPVIIFWLAAFSAIPALLSLRLIGGTHARPVSPTAGAQAGPGTVPSLIRAELARLFLDRRVLIFVVCVMLFFIASAAMGPIVAGRVTRRRPELATLIVAGTMLLPQAIVAVISPWIGRRAEHSGRRPMLLLGWGLLPLQGLLYALAESPYTLLICQILSGVSGAVFGVLTQVIAKDLTLGTGRFNLTLGVFGVAIAIGASLSTAIAGMVVAVLGGSAAFLVLAAVGLAAALLLLIGMPETRPVETEGARDRAS